MRRGSGEVAGVEDEEGGRGTRADGEGDRAVLDMLGSGKSTRMKRRNRWFRSAAQVRPRAAMATAAPARWWWWFRFLLTVALVERRQRGSGGAVDVEEEG
jgi:hypothetical protein